MKLTNEEIDNPLGAYLIGTVLKSCIDGSRLDSNAKFIAQKLTDHLSFEDLKGMYYQNKYIFYTENYSAEQLEKMVFDLGDEPIARQLYFSRN